jgi:hypothetical protein
MDMKSGVPGKSFLSGPKFAAGLMNGLTDDDEASHILLSVPWVGYQPFTMRPETAHYHALGQVLPPAFPEQ